MKKWSILFQANGKLEYLTLNADNVFVSESVWRFENDTAAGAELVAIFNSANVVYAASDSEK